MLELQVNDLAERTKYQEAARLVCVLLDGQRLFIGPISLVDREGAVNARALGYVLGFVDCCLQIAKLDLGSDYGRGVLSLALSEFDPSNADALFAYAANPRCTAALMEA